MVVTTIGALQILRFCHYCSTGNAQDFGDAVHDEFKQQVLHQILVVYLLVVNNPSYMLH